MSNIHRVKLVVVPDAGAQIHHVVGEALILALSEKRSTSFEFNGTRVEIEPDDVIAQFVDRWYQKRRSEPQG